MPEERAKSMLAGRSVDQITLQEIQDALADEGYSANQRKGWLKELLTDLERAQAADPSGDHAELVGEIKEIIRRYQHGKPMSDDLS